MESRAAQQVMRSMRSRGAQLRHRLLSQQRHDSTTATAGVAAPVASPAASATMAAAPAPAAAPKPAFDPTKAPVQLRMPGPAWLWRPLLRPLKVPVGAYNRANKARPWATQVATSLVIYAAGDLSSQYIARPRGADGAATDEANGETSTAKPFAWYEGERTLRALAIGGTISIPSYTWFMWLSRQFPGMALPRAVALKVLIISTVFAPLINGYFFSMQSLLSGRGAEGGWRGRAGAAWARVRDAVPTSWLNGCAFWPFVTAFSFTFVPPVNRAIFAGGMAVGWQTYLGLLNQRAARGEVGAGGVARQSGVVKAVAAPA